MLLTLAVAAALCSVLALLWFFGESEPGAESAALSSDFVRFEVIDGEGTASVAERLESAGLVESGSSFRWYKQLYHPFSTLEPGAHWLPAKSPPRTLVRLLARLRGRPQARVAFPEGWDSFQIAARLAQTGICNDSEFLSLVLAEQPDAQQKTYEGYLYPASYDFRLNSTPETVLARLFKEAQQRFAQTFETHAPALSKVQQRYGLGAEELVTLASIVEKEAADASEFGTIASVFYNRLSDPSFKPRSMLQSDPTAGYGCKLPGAPASCHGFTGRITPALIRDPANRYNTYRNPGLPPGPIGNPSLTALRAVLDPPQTPYFFFVGHNGGRHTFSRTLKEHQDATKITK